MEKHLSGTERALVLLSGGIDSTVSLYWALSKGWEVRTLEFEYYQRPRREKTACRHLRERVGIVSPIIVPLGFVREVSDLDERELVGSFWGQAPQGYIPSRNLLFYSFAAYYAEIMGARYIVGGHNRGDAEEFPDAGSKFFGQMNELLKSSMWSHSKLNAEIILPLMGLGKAEVVRTGEALKVPFELTWSCYHNAEVPCGVCGSCSERREAFCDAGIRDPLVA
jgi:7-cyano-7-deazaguanine synthase